MPTTETKPRAVLRKDYRPPPYWIETVELAFELGRDSTLVRSRMRLLRNAQSRGGPLVLDGEALETLAVRVDGRELGAAEYSIENDHMTFDSVPDEFVLETEVRIRPRENTALSGLYVSGDVLCTQCEAMGFRRITWFLDRPDVMARYTTTIVGDRASFPVMLSNGNRVAERELDRGRHEVRWEDPFPKPSYLFALVAGELRCHAGRFVTRTGRDVRLEIWVEPQNVDRCEHALRSLQKAMKWDEERFGLEYDLDLYMVVAVNDFNAGAMENKGLNIFNSKYVLAKPETATDMDYEGIEGVIGHEYFHNWTGNRVTCRDWFQLTLKEGLTVFRDQEFSAEMTSAPVKRIADVKLLRTSQFAEDDGPMAHAVRPDSYISMENFYTVTVYNKGAEVVRMYQTLLGREGFRRGMDLYFERHDGGAVTCEDFRAAMADANGVDLELFGRWYAQPGTPIVAARAEYDRDARRFTLELSQSRPVLDGQPAYEPMHVPVALGLVGPDGADLPFRFEGVEHDGTLVVELKEARQSFTFEKVDEEPVPSVLRGFSAPVKLQMERSREELAFLLAHDSDPFNRWDAGQELAQALLLDLAREAAAGRDLRLDPLFTQAFGRVLADPALDGSIKSLTLLLPGERHLGMQMDVIEVDAIHRARQFVRKELARTLRDEWVALFDANGSQSPYRNDKRSIDRRRLKNTALAYLACLEERSTTETVWRQFETSDNMTDAQAALVLLVDLDCPEREQALAAFHEHWQDDPLVLDKWFQAQALSSLPDTTSRVEELTRHADFHLKNPNRVRSLVGAYAGMNQVRFHDADGGGYRLVAGKVLELDTINPRIAARVASAFNRWKRFDAARRTLMRAELERIEAHAGLSKDVFEIVARALGRD